MRANASVLGFCRETVDVDTYVCAPLIRGDEPEYVWRDVTLTSLLTPFVGPEMQGWIKTSEDPYPRALEPCGFPSPSVFDAPSDLLLVNKIEHNGWDVSTEIRLQKDSFSCCCPQKETRCRVVSCLWRHHLARR